MFPRDVSAHALTLMALESQLLGSLGRRRTSGHKWLSKLEVGCLWTLSGFCWAVLAHLNLVSRCCHWHVGPVAVWARPRGITTCLFSLCTLLSSPVIPLLNRTYLNPQHECVPHRRTHRSPGQHVQSVWTSRLGYHMNKELVVSTFRQTC